MSTWIFFVSLCAALQLATVVVLFRRINVLPARMRLLAKEERVQDEKRAVNALQEATAVKVGQITSALRQLEEQASAEFRARVAEAQARARIAEQAGSDAATALQTAVDLVREARELVNRLQTRSDAKERSEPPPEQPAAEESPESARRTVEMKRPPESCAPPPGAPGDAEDEPEEELTVVVDRSAPASTRNPLRGLRSTIVPTAEAATPEHDP